MQNVIPQDLIDILIETGNRLDTVEQGLTNDAVPVGAEFIWPASTALLPFNYHSSDGTALDRIGYAALFQQIGTTYGIGDGATTFEIPDRTNAQFYIPAVISPVAPTLLNSWANLGTGFDVAGYYKDSDGLVHLQGTITNPGAVATGGVIFNLPANFRPPLQKIYSQWGISNIENNQRIDIEIDGDVVYNGGAITSMTYVSLSGMYFNSGVLPTPVATNGQTVVIKIL